MRDFTLKSYGDLLITLKESNYNFITFEEYIINQHGFEKWCILRHDVDRLPWNALKMAQIENEENISASYYFRIAKEAYDSELIKSIVKLNHEAGYHYEDMDLTNGNIEKAYDSYLKNLKHFRTFYPIKTICMHGSPLSKFDNREIWTKYDYKKNEIIGEPYFDINFEDIFYLTDTGRFWNNEEVSVRDKVISNYNYEISHIKDIINMAKNNILPYKIMINTHPHRWFDNYIPWFKELVFQNIKNQFKRIIIKNNNK
jgi:hypothetical protein